MSINKYLENAVTLAYQKANEDLQLYNASLNLTLKAVVLKHGGKLVIEQEFLDMAKNTSHALAEKNENGILLSLEPME